MHATDWLSTSQVAARLDVSSARVRQMLAAGRIAHFTTPIGRLITKEEAERHLAGARERLARLEAKRADGA